MNHCAAGTELPKRGSCPKCGATSSEPCPEALRIAREERETLIRALEYALKELDYVAVKHGYVTTETAAVRVRDALAAVSTPGEPNG